ncbi:MAG: Tn3 family transposase [Candidatus Aminicenantes bacterium]|nr:Tn3 family transposase [Candidatus Aminicenantes bacterium]
MSFLRLTKIRPIVLVTAAIVLWNTVYLERATKALIDHGQKIDPG